MSDSKINSIKMPTALSKGTLNQSTVGNHLFYIKNDTKIFKICSVSKAKSKSEKAKQTIIERNTVCLENQEQTFALTYEKADTSKSDKEDRDEQWALWLSEAKKAFKSTEHRSKTDQIISKEDKIIDDEDESVKNILLSLLDSNVKDKDVFLNLLDANAVYVSIKNNLVITDNGTKRKLITDFNAMTIGRSETTDAFAARIQKQRFINDLYETNQHFNDHMIFDKFVQGLIRPGIDARDQPYLNILDKYLITKDMTPKEILDGYALISIKESQLLEEGKVNYAPISVAAASNYSNPWQPHNHSQPHRSAATPSLPVNTPVPWCRVHGYGHSDAQCTFQIYNPNAQIIPSAKSRWESVNGRYVGNRENSPWYKAPDANLKSAKKAAAVKVKANSIYAAFGEFNKANPGGDEATFQAYFQANSNKFVQNYSTVYPTSIIHTFDTACTPFHVSPEINGKVEEFASPIKIELAGNDSAMYATGMGTNTLIDSFGTVISLPETLVCKEASQGLISGPAIRRQKRHRINITDDEVVLTNNDNGSRFRILFNEDDELWSVPCPSSSNPSNKSATALQVAIPDEIIMNLGELSADAPGVSADSPQHKSGNALPTHSNDYIPDTADVPSKKRATKKSKRLPFYGPQTFYEHQSNAPLKYPIIASESESLLIHKRFMYANFPYIQTMITKKMVHGIHVDGVIQINCKCDGCMQGKAKELSWPGHPKPEKEVLKPGEGIVIDLWGKAPVSTPRREKYSATYTDINSRLSLGKLLKRKLEQKIKFKDVEAYMERQTGNKLKLVHFDLGTEFVDGEFLQYLRDKGIQISYSPVDTKELNSIAERKNLTHMSKTLAAMSDSGLAPTYWGDVFLASVYVNNMTYTSANKDFTTPFERFYGYKPQVGHLRVIGSIAWLYIRRALRNKLEKKAIPCSLVGYSEHSKSYKVVDIVTGKYYESRHIIFDETKTAKDFRKQPEVLTCISISDPDTFAKLEEQFEASFLEDDSDEETPAPKSSTIQLHIDIEPASDSDDEAAPPVNVTSDNQRDTVAPPDLAEMSFNSLDEEETEIYQAAQPLKVRFDGIPDSPDSPLLRYSGPQYGDIFEPDLFEELPPPAMKDSTFFYEPVTEENTTNPDRSNESASNIIPDGVKRNRYPTAKIAELEFEENAFIPLHDDASITKENVSLPEDIELPDFIDDTILNDIDSPFVMKGDIVHAESDPNLKSLSWAQMMKSPNRDKYLNAAKAELNAHSKNGTFEEVSGLMEGYIALGTKWVFTIKRDEHGHPVRFKARLVLQGYRQRAGIDYFYTASPVAKTTSIRALLLLSALLDLEVEGMDVDTAYLNANMKQLLFTKLPNGFTPLDASTKYLIVRKALYGAKQSGREWYELLTDTLKELGYVQLKTDPCVFTLQKHLANGEILYICIYVDDLLIMGTPSAVKKFKKEISSRFKMKDLGEAVKFTGFEIYRDRTSHRIYLSQHVYTQDILQKYGFTDITPSRIPADPNVDLSIRFLSPPDDEETVFLKTIDFRGMIGSILYLTKTRPELYAALIPLCQHVGNPRRIHYTAIVKIFAYLAFCIKYNGRMGITLGGSVINPSDPLSIIAFSDSNWGKCLDTRRSQFGAILTMNGSAVSVSSGMSKTIAQNTAEAETQSGNESAKDIVAMSQFLMELNVPFLVPILKIDNQSAKAIAENDTLAKASRHMDIKLLWLRELVARNQLTLEYCPTRDMIADILTKPLPRPAFERLRPLLGVVPFDSFRDRGSVAAI